jgi:nucleoside-diphosphate-sugar epimerase
MKNTLVTGGSGFVGGRLIRRLVDQGVRVRALARSEDAAQKISALGAEVVPGSLESEDSLRAAVKDVDVVFHAAARMDFAGSYPAHRETNVEGTRRLVEAIQSSGGGARLVYVSAAAVMLGESRQISSRGLPPARFASAYARSKAEAEHVIRDQEDLDWIIVRPGLIWGPGDSSFVPEVARAVSDRRFVWVEGGRYPYSTVHVDRLCDGLARAAEAGEQHSVYYFTDGPPRVFREFVEERLAEVGVRVPGLSLPRWLARSSAQLTDLVWRLPLLRRFEPPITAALIDLIGDEVSIDDRASREELGYTGELPMEEAA